jgi:hypothetical protein
MHSRAAVAEVLALRSTGIGARRIARRLDLPLSTVRDWLAGKVPKHSRDGAAPAGSVCQRCGCDAHQFDELPSDYAYLLGLYLGDGCISAHPRDVFRLRITLDSRYPGIIAAAAAAVAEVRGGPAAVQRRAHENCVEVYSYWKQWPCYLPQHGAGLKHKRRIFLADWQQGLVEQWPDQLVRGLIHSDGCRFTNTGRGNWVCPRYAFYQVSTDIQDIFCLASDLVGVHWTRSGKRTIYVSRKADVALLDTFIGPKA